MLLFLQQNTPTWERVAFNAAITDRFTKKAMIKTTVTLEAPITNSVVFKAKITDTFTKKAPITNAITLKSKII